MTIRTLAALFATVALLAVAGCTTEESRPAASRSPSPVEGRVPTTCEHLSHHDALRPFIGGGDGEFPNDGARRDEHNTCYLVTRVNDPVKGMLRFRLAVNVIEAGEELEDLGPPNLSSCYGTAKCWIGKPETCKAGKKTSDPELRVFATEGRAVPYRVRLDVGLWPNNYKRDLCKADQWSEEMAQEFLKMALAYLSTGK